MDLSKENVDLDLTSLKLGKKGKEKVDALKENPTREKVMDALCDTYGVTEDEINRYENFLIQRLSLINKVVDELIYLLFPVLILR